MGEMMQSMKKFRPAVKYQLTQHGYFTTDLRENSVEFKAVIRRLKKIYKDKFIYVRKMK